MSDKYFGHFVIALEPHAIHYIILELSGLVQATLMQENKWYNIKQ